MTPGPLRPVADGVDCLPVFIRIMSAVSLFLHHVDKFGGDGALLLEVPRAPRSLQLTALLWPLFSRCIVVASTFLAANGEKNRQESKGHGPDVS